MSLNSMAAIPMSTALLKGSQQDITAKRMAGMAQTSEATSKASGKDGTEITSNDFLTLLVTELKNQDPTQPTDPNAYIQQLVGVNSLQQLISINQALGGTSATTAATENVPLVRSSEV